MRVHVATAVAGYVGAVIATNVVTASFGLWPVGFGLSATAGTVLAGTSFVLRDAVQEVAGRRMALLALAAGCAISAWMATPALALASAAAFGLAELLDMGVYTKLREKGWLRAAAASNTVGAVVDTVVFLTVASFPVTASLVVGQIIGKMWATAGVVGAMLALRAWMRRA